jgi:diguanylate cyclase (GGDEF)-like protein
MAKFLITIAVMLFSLCSGFYSGSLAAAEQSDNYKRVLSVAIEADDVAARVLFNAASYEFNFNIHYQTMKSFDALLKAVETGVVDFAANVTYTPERAERFDFSRPTNIEYTYLFSKQGKTLQQVSRVGVPKETIFGDLLATHYPQIEQVAYSSGKEALALLHSGQVDGIVDAINQLKPMLSAGYQASLLNDDLPIQPVAIIATKGEHQEFLAKLENFAHQPAIQQLLSRSIENYQREVRIKALRSLVREVGLNTQKSYKVKLENRIKYAQYSNDGKVKGISADVVFGSCEILMLKCDLVSRRDESWNSMYNDLVNNRIDVLSPTIKSIPRQSKMHFSDVYYRPSAVMVKREGYKSDVYRNVSELLVEKIGVVEGDFYQELMQRLLPNKELITFPDQAALLKGLLNRQVDYIVATHTLYNQMLRQSDPYIPIEEDMLIGDFYHSEVSVAFPKTEEGKQLAELFSRAMKILDINEIVNRYEDLPDWRATLVAEKRMAEQWMWLLLVILIALIGLVGYLHAQSNTDGLTKLRNRRALYRRFIRGVSPRTTIVFLDVNHFKEINDSYGHDVGDKVLQQLADKINAYWKGRSYRIGGDEFILTDTLNEAELSRILPMLSHFVYVDLVKNYSFNVTVSVGISPNRLDPMSLEEVLHLADVEMYRAKYRARSEAAMMRNKSEDAPILSQLPVQ